jgi:hypothetical protein
MSNTCGCGGNSTSPVTPPQNDSGASTVDLTPGSAIADLSEVTSFMSIVDGATGLYGLLRSGPDGSGNVTVETMANGKTFTYVLSPSNTDSFVDFTTTQFPVSVIGAFIPQKAFRDDDARSVNQTYRVAGNVFALEPWSPRVPGFDVISGRVNRGTVAKLLQKDDAHLTRLLDMLDLDSKASESDKVHYLLLASGVITDLVQRIQRESGSAAQLFAFVRTALNADFQTAHINFINAQYTLNSIDIVPGKPGVDSGTVYPVFRYLQNGGVDLRTLVATVHLRRRSDLSLALPVDSVEEVSSQDWDPAQCASCRRACAAAAKRCQETAPGHGPKAVAAIANCLLDAAECYVACGC